LRSTAIERYLAIAALYDRLKWAQYIRFGTEEDAMPEAQNDIDYTVDIGRHETTFHANTPKGEEFLGGVEDWLQQPSQTRGLFGHRTNTAIAVNTIGTSPKITTQTRNQKSCSVPAGSRAARHKRPMNDASCSGTSPRSAQRWLSSMAISSETSREQPSAVLKLTTRTGLLYAPPCAARWRSRCRLRQSPAMPGPAGGRTWI
jgi:hypothetical protein